MELLLLGAGLLYWFSKQGKKFVKNLSLKTVKVHKISFDNSKSLAAGYLKLFFKVELKVENPTDAGATISNVALKVNYNGKPIAIADLPGAIKFTPQQTKSVFVTLQVPVLQAASGIREAAQMLIAKKPFDVDVVGYVEMLGGRVNFAEKLPVAI